MEKAKVLKTSGTRVVVGMNDGTTKSFDLEDFNYDPMIGDVVDIYGTEESPLISKAETKEDIPSQGGNTGGSQNVYVNLQQPTVSSGGKKVSKVVYCLLAFFLGGVGGHEFYAGHIGAGIVMLLFCWTCIPSFVALVQLIVALCKHSDANGMIEV